MKLTIVFLALALITGGLIPIQAATNAAFSRAVSSPVITGTMVSLLGFLTMVSLSLVMKTPTPSIAQLTTAPWYSYLGGIIVASYIVMITVLVPKIGVGTAISFIVTGQILCAVAIDHFGLFNTPVRHVNASRILGVLMMIVGIYLVMKKH